MQDVETPIPILNHYATKYPTTLVEYLEATNSPQNYALIKTPYFYLTTEGTSSFVITNNPFSKRTLQLDEQSIGLIQLPLEQPQPLKETQDKQGNSLDQKKQEEQSADKVAKKKHKKQSRRRHKRIKDKNRKPKRLRKQIEESDPRYRGVPKLKKIKKRKNKPKVIPQQVKKEAQVKREEDQYYKKIENRGKISLSNIKRRQKQYPKSKNLKLATKMEEGQVKLEQQSQLQSSQTSQQSQSKEKETVVQRQIKRRVSRKQRQKERQQDNLKVDSLMKAKGQRQRREQIENMVRMQRLMLGRFGEKVNLQFDPKCKYYSQFKCKKGEIDKIGRLYCQIYNKNPMPSKGRHFFHMKIVRLTYQSITIGVITQQNFQNQYSRDKGNCICFDAYTHSIYVQGEKQELQVEVKLNDIIRTIVDIEKASIQWYINNEMIGEARIPPHMAQAALYPYLQISNKWIKLRINDFIQ